MDSIRIRVDGGDVVPDLTWNDEEDAHRWVSQHHPGMPYTIIHSREGKPDFALTYRPRRT
jgi:hypothetical protein